MSSLVEEIAQEKNLTPPFILRFPQLLTAQIEGLHNAFGTAIRDNNYGASYYGLFPVKVNQDREVIEQMVSLGERLDHGLEVGSKGELIAAIGSIRNPQSTLVVNGYKDAEFIDMALMAQKIGLRVILVVETPDELDLILRRAPLADVTPNLGLRLRLSASPGGPWCKTNEIFGLTSTETIAAIDRLKADGRLDWLKMIHFHQGSQLGSLEDIRKGIKEGVRAYIDIFKEGAAIDMLNVGGGLAVAYDGSGDDPDASKDYDVTDYAKTIVETVRDALDAEGIPHPTIYTESGRAVCASHCVFVLGLHSVSPYLEPSSHPVDHAPAGPVLRSLLEKIKSANLLTFLKLRKSWAGQIDELFVTGEIDLRQRAAAESALRLAATSLAKSSDEVAQLEIHDVAYANFSVFQSLPDHWGIRQKFPLMPLQRLNQRPDRLANISDLTCDCDGRLSWPNPSSDENSFVPIHSIAADEDYYLGVFLSGAYQESLGGMHNLLGRTHSVNITAEDGEFEIGRCRKGQSNSDILGIFGYEPESLFRGLSQQVSSALDRGEISGAEATTFINSYRSSLQGNPYLSNRAQRNNGQ